MQPGHSPQGWVNGTMSGRRGGFQPAGLIARDRTRRARGRGRTHSTDICSYIGVLLAYLVGVQRLPVGFGEGRHLQAERGVSLAPGAVCCQEPLGEERLQPASSPSPGPWEGETRTRSPEAARGGGRLSLIPIPSPGAHRSGEQQELTGDQLSTRHPELGWRDVW